MSSPPVDCGPHPPRPRRHPAERLRINPDCGLVHLPREVAFNKLSAMSEGTRLVREGLK
jgi:methionine synthase II (cobalamin-independent)